MSSAKKSDPSCRRLGCYCKLFAKDTSKWSKGKCRNCNHSLKEHGKDLIASVKTDEPKLNVAPPKIKPNPPKTIKMQPNQIKASESKKNPPPAPPKEVITEEKKEEKQSEIVKIPPPFNPNIVPPPPPIIQNSDENSEDILAPEKTPPVFIPDDTIAIIKSDETKKNQPEKQDKSTKKPPTFVAKNVYSFKKLNSKKSVPSIKKIKSLKKKKTKHVARSKSHKIIVNQDKFDDEIESKKYIEWSSDELFYWIKLKLNWVKDYKSTNDIDYIHEERMMTYLDGMKEHKMDGKMVDEIMKNDKILTKAGFTFTQRKSIKSAISKLIK